MLHRHLNPPVIDEEIWTCVFTLGFIEAKKELFRSLTEGGVHSGEPQTWLEMLPLPPRKGTSGESEGNSNIDLVVGSVGNRGKTESGLQYDPGAGDSICLVEAKWLSDLSCKTAHDAHRNQLARVIESAVTLQHHSALAPGKKYDPVEEKHFPLDVHFTLLTPAAFRGRPSHSRLYSYKFWEYKNSAEAILEDIKGCNVPSRLDSNNWVYPDLEERIQSIQLHWVTYEELFVAMPEGDEKEKVRGFVLKHGGSGNKNANGGWMKNEILDMAVFKKEVK